MSGKVVHFEVPADDVERARAFYREGKIGRSRVHRELIGGYVSPDKPGMNSENGTSNPKVVTVSRDALRADLADLELRLHTWMSEELDKKANDTDFGVLRQEIRVTADAVTTTREAAAKQLSEALYEAGKTGESRFSKLENAQARLFGGIVLSGFLAPVLTGLFVYFASKTG